MIFFLFKKFLSSFKKFVLGEISFINRHSLILDGHDNHVIFETISQAQEMGLKMITLLSHTSHDLQPLDVFCFKPFKTTFRKVRYATMSINNHIEPDKITLVGWVDKALEQSGSKKISSLDLRPHVYGPFNPKAMDRITKFHKYTLQN